MPFSSENLLRQLDQPEIIDWALELKNRRDALAFLMQEVRGNQLNENQFRNALHALYRIAFPENTTEVLQTFVDLSEHPDMEIRSYAVQLAIALVQTSTNLRTPLIFSDSQEKSIREAATRGLTPKVAQLVQRFFTI